LDTSWTPSTDLLIPKLFKSNHLENYYPQGLLGDDLVSRIKVDYGK